MARLFVTKAFHDSFLSPAWVIKPREVMNELNPDPDWLNRVLSAETWSGGISRMDHTENKGTAPPASRNAPNIFSRNWACLLWPPALGYPASTSKRGLPPAIEIIRGTSKAGDADDLC